jgi:hypothetical protein
VLAAVAFIAAPAVGWAMSINVSPSPASLPAPGGTFNFTVTVNANPLAFLSNVNSLTDDRYGNLDGQGTCSVSGLNLRPLPYSCTYSGTFTGAAGATQMNTVSGLGTECSDGLVLCLPVLAAGSAMVSLTDSAPPATSTPPSPLTTTPGTTTTRKKCKKGRKLVKGKCVKKKKKKRSSRQKPRGYQSDTRSRHRNVQNWIVRRHLAQ